MNDQVSEEIKVEQMVRFLRWGLIVVVVIAVVGVAVNVIQRRKAHEAEKAFSLLFQAEKIEESAATPGETGQQEQSILPSVESMMKWDDAKKSEYVSKLESVIREYPNSVAASLAGLRLGRWHFANKNYDKAVETYRTVIEHARNDKDHPLYLAMAFEGLGVTYETNSKFDEAYKTFSEALALPNNPLKPLAYLGAARVLEQQGKASDAKAQYEKLISEFPNTDYERRARALMALTSAKG